MRAGWRSTGHAGRMLRPRRLAAAIGPSYGVTGRTSRCALSGGLVRKLWPATGLERIRNAGCPAVNRAAHCFARASRPSPPARPVPASAPSPSGAAGPPSGAGRSGQRGPASLMRCHIARERVVMSRGAAAAAWRRAGAAAAWPARRCRRSGRPSDGGSPARCPFRARCSRPAAPVPAAAPASGPHLAPIGCGRKPQIRARIDCKPCKVRLVDAGGASVAEVIGSGASLCPGPGQGQGRGFGIYGTRPRRAARS